MANTIISYANSLLQILVGFFFCMALPVVVFEKVDVLGSIGRALKLMTDHRWRLFWSLLIVYILGYFIGGLVLSCLAIPIVFAVMIKSMVAYILVGILCLGGLFVLIYLGAYFFGPLTAIYYDLLIRKEGYDLQIQLGSDTDQAPSRPLQI